MIKAGLNLKIKRLLKKNTKTRKSIAYERAKKILVFFTAEGNEKFHSILDFTKKFKADEKEVSYLYLLLKNEDLPDVGLNKDMLALSKKEISLFGEIKDDDVVKMLEEPYDYLIHADVDHNHYTDLVMASSQANCRVGKLEEMKEDFYDLMISTNNGSQLKKLLDQFYHYLKFLK